MPIGLAVTPAAVGIENSVNAPAVVMRPILLAPSSVNHSAPSGPAVISCGLAVAVGIENWVNCAGGGDPANLVGAILGEPQRAVGARRDAQGMATGRGDRESVNVTLLRDTPDAANRTIAASTKLPLRFRMYCPAGRPRRCAGRGTRK